MEKGVLKKKDTKCGGGGVGGVRVICTVYLLLLTHLPDPCAKPGTLIGVILRGPPRSASPSQPRVLKKARGHSSHES